MNGATARPDCAEPSGAVSSTVQEIPLVIDCQGSELIAMLHLPTQPQARGMLSIVAGGPQYRGGVCRMQVHMARQLAAAGVPVLRFDYRGLGDSEGSFLGFLHVEDDLRAALAAFRARVPQLREVVLWGGCDAASASLIHAWKFPEVTGMVLGNPWVHSETTADVVEIRHYGQRMRDWDFWLKVLKLQYNPLPAAATLARGALGRLRRPAGTGAGAAVAIDETGLPFVERMRLGMQRFGGEVLLLMSGRSLRSQEFDELVRGNDPWQQALRAPRRVVRHDIPEGDQAFSTIATRVEVNDVTQRWLIDPAAVQSNDTTMASAQP
jgi:uncharacterized protein